jgi:hypothetical protein
MNPIFRPLAGLLLLGAAAAACADNHVDLDNAIMPVDQTGAGVGSVRADDRSVDNGLLALRSYAADRAAVGPVGFETRVNYSYPGARGGSSLDLGTHRDLGNDAWDWRNLKAGLNRKLDSGWLVALNYTRAYGAAGGYDRSALPSARLDGRPAFLNAGRRALVLSLARAF